MGKKLTKIVLAIFATFLTSVFIASPALGATSISISSPNNNSSISGDTFTVTGTATPKRAVTVSVNGSAVGTTTSDSSGNWALNVSGQSPGEKTVTATASVQYAYVVNSGAASMSVINTVTDEVVNTVNTTSNQNTIAISPDGNQLVTVSNIGGDGSIRVFSLADPENPVITNNLTAANTYAVNVAYSPNGTYFYVTSVQSGFGSSAVTRYSSSSPGTSSAVSGYNQSFPAGLALNSGGDTLYVSNVLSGTVSVVNTATNTQTSTFSTGGATNAGSIILGANNSNGYIAASNNDVIIPVNVTAGTTSSTIAVGDAPRGLTFNQDQSRVVVANFSGNSLSIINTANNTVVDTVSTGTGTSPQIPAYNSNFSKLYVTYVGSDQVALLNPTTFAVNSTISVGDQPTSIAFGATQSASATTSFTLTSGSLADTGQDMNSFIILSFALVVTGVVGASYVRYRYQHI